MNVTYDGDTVSLNVLYSKNAIEEVNKTLTKREAYVNPAGGFRASMETDTTVFIFNNMTGD